MTNKWYCYSIHEIRETVRSQEKVTNMIQRRMLLFGQIMVALGIANIFVSAGFLMQGIHVLRGTAQTCAAIQLALGGLLTMVGVSMTFGALPDE